MSAAAKGIPAQVSLPFCQIALSVSSLARTHRWYRRVFGLLPAGHFGRYGNEEMAQAQMLPETDYLIGWLSDRQDWFEFELFQFDKPQPKAMPQDWRPSDIGYTGFSMQVADFDATLHRIATIGGRLLSAPLGVPGERRVCVRDPDGVLIEVIEGAVMVPGSPPRVRPELPAAVRSVTISVLDLAAARDFWIDCLGLQEIPGFALHTPDHEAMWGLDGAKRESATLASGEFLIELVQYRHPVGRSRPAGALICDHGLMNIAFGTRSETDFYAVYQRLVAGGFRGDVEPWNFGKGHFIYLRSNEDLCVELLHVLPGEEAALGFLPSTPESSRP
jgi:catechol 2,3-dioxygenase-like lactoylglutathione lyase family enzyme